MVSVIITCITIQYHQSGQRTNDLLISCPLPKTLHLTKQWSQTLTERLQYWGPFSFFQVSCQVSRVISTHLRQQDGNNRHKVKQERWSTQTDPPIGKVFQEANPGSARTSSLRPVCTSGQHQPSAGCRETEATTHPSGRPDPPNPPLGTPWPILRTPWPTQPIPQDALPQPTHPQDALPHATHPQDALTHPIGTSCLTNSRQEK